MRGQLGPEYPGSPFEQLHLPQGDLIAFKPVGVYPAPQDGIAYLGWTSNCWASSASVFLPLIAATATFALKAGACFRRGRLLIVSPAPRPFWPRSGRNSTYLAVQIR